MENFEVGDLVMLTGSYCGTTASGPDYFGTNYAAYDNITNDDILIVDQVSNAGSPRFENKSYWQNAHNFTKVGSL